MQRNPLGHGANMSLRGWQQVCPIKKSAW